MSWPRGRGKGTVKQQEMLRDIKLCRGIVSKDTGLHFRRGQRDQEKQRGDFVCMSLQAGVLFSRKDLACHYKQMCCFQGRTSR